MTYTYAVYSLGTASILRILVTVLCLSFFLYQSANHMVLVDYEYHLLNLKLIILDSLT